MFPRRGPAFYCMQLCVTAGMVLAVGAALPARGVAASTAAELPADLAAYRNHLAQLDALVAGCQKQRDSAACDPAQVGADDHVRWPAGSGAERTIGYDWLRTLLNEAGKGKAAQAAPAVHLGVAPGVVKTPPPSLDKLLTAARARLDADAKQIEAQPASAADYAQERQALTVILARREYNGVTKVTVRDRFLEWLGNALDAFFGKLAGLGAGMPWIWIVVRALLIGGLCVLLAWLLVRIERRSRMGLIDGVPVAPGAPSAREWQLWLKDAQAMEAQGLWREAIHFLYWAAISRLESRRLWPADRARTPREYLHLLPAADANRQGLTALTRTFERTWYGGREATSAEYQAASRLAAGMGVE